MKLWLLALVGVLGCLAVSRGHAAPPAQWRAIETGEKSAAPLVTNFAPTKYFNENCARCHGENGAFYGDDFGGNLDDKRLHQIVDEMAQGPGAAPLDEHDLTILTAWHRALRDKKPFVAIIKSEKAGAQWQLSGEISPDATLTINGQAVEVKGTQWTHCVEAGAVKLRAQKGDAVTELDARVAAFAP